MRLDHIIHDLFLLMLNLTQFKDQDRIQKVFIEAVDTLWVDVHLRMLPEGEIGNGETIKIATSRNSFGSVSIEGKLDDVPDDLLSIMRNSVRMLAIILENRMQEEEREKLITELQEALKEIKTLRGILPLCSHCKKIRDDKGYWEQVDVYIHKHSQADISFLSTLSSTHKAKYRCFQSNPHQCRYQALQLLQNLFRFHPA